MSSFTAHGSDKFTALSVTIASGATGDLSLGAGGEGITVSDITATRTDVLGGNSPTTYNPRLYMSPNTPIKNIGTLDIGQRGGGYHSTISKAQITNLGLLAINSYTIASAITNGGFGLITIGSSGRIYGGIQGSGFVENSGLINVGDVNLSASATYRSGASFINDHSGEVETDLNVTGQAGNISNNGRFDRNVNISGSYSTVNNAGNIFGSLNVAGTDTSVTNGAGAYIFEGLTVESNSINTYVFNQGRILATSNILGYASTINNSGSLSGLYLYGNGSQVTNLAGGVISFGATLAANGVRLVNAAGSKFFGPLHAWGAGDTIVLHGTIFAPSISFSDGYYHPSGGKLVLGADLVSLGGLIDTAQTGTVLELATGGNAAGNLTNFAGKWNHFAGIQVDPGATWTMAGLNTGAFGTNNSANYSFTAPVTTSGTLINAATISGVVSATSGGTIVNSSSGVITTPGGQTTAAVGVSLAAGGVLINQAGATINGSLGFRSGKGGDPGVTVRNGGTITGGVQFGSGNDRLGIYAGAAFGGTVDAGGGFDTIELMSTSPGVTGTLAGLGTVINGFRALKVDAGASWSLTPGIFGDYGQAVTVSGTLASGVRVNGSVLLDTVGALFTNTGGAVVYSYRQAAVLGKYGVENVDNAGLIQGGTATGGGGVYLTQGGSVTNRAGAEIFGEFGIYEKLNPGTVVNSGVIAGVGPGGWSGIALAAGGSITNTSSGVIQSSNGAGIVIGGYGAGLVVNSGYIMGGNGVAVLFNSPNGRLIDNPGAAFGGAVQANGGGVLELAAGPAAGTLNNLGSSFSGFTGVTVDAGATWTLGSNSSIGSPTTLTNSGTLLADGMFTNDGSIAGSLTLTSGTTFRNTGHVSSAAHFTSGGRLVATPGAGFGAVVSGTNSTLELAAGGGTGTLSGLSTSFTGFTTVTIDAGAAWQLNGATVASGTGLTNAGTITGDLTLGSAASVANAVGARLVGKLTSGAANAAFTNAGVQSGSGYAVSFTSGGSVTNAATGTISNYAGLRLSGGAGTVVNSGVISDTQYAVQLASGGVVLNNAGGVIASAFKYGLTVAGGGTVTNAGTITGGNGHAAVKFDASTSRLIVRAGAVFQGAVQGGGANSTLELASSTASGVITGLGTSFTGFGNVTVDAGASWNLAGSATIASGVLTNSGTVSGNTTLGSGTSLVNTAGARFAATAVGKAGGVSIVNAGAITGAYYGVQLAGGSVTNLAGGTISNNDAVLIGTASGTVTNSGSIGARYFGVRLSSGGIVTNTAGGTISGSLAVSAYGGAGSTVMNAGVINGSLNGTAATAVQLGSGTSRLIVKAGAVFTGAVLGGGANSTLELSTGGGTLSGLGTQFTGFGAIQVDSGTQWTLTGANTVASSSVITNSGSLAILGATLTGGGGLVNNGSILIDPSSVMVSSLSGTGSVTIDAGSSLTVSGAVGSGETIVFSGTGAVLDLGTPSAMAGTIAGFAQGDTIDLASLAFAAGGTVALNSATDVLTIVESGTTVTEQLAGNFTGKYFKLASDGGGGTALSLTPIAPPVVTAGLVHDTGVAGDGITSNPALTGSGSAGGTVTIRNGGTVLGTVAIAPTANIVANPSFGPANGGNGYGAVAGWMSGTGSTGSNGSSQPFWDNGTVPAGTTSVGFVQYANDFLSQNLSLVAGTTYVLTYLENARSYGGGVPVVEALVGGLVVVAAHADAPVGGTASFRTETATFVATSASETLEFLTTSTGSGPTDATALYANVSVSALNGAWSYTPKLPDGSYTLSASEVDVAGNTGSTSLAFTLDTKAPIVTVALAVDTGVPTDKVTSVAMLSGAADPNGTVTITNGAATLGTAIANAAGAWSFTPVLADGSYTLSATDTDVAGNIGSGTVSFTLDTTAPVVSVALAVDTGVPADKVTSVATLSGGADPNGTVTITNGAATLGTAIANAAGVWSFTPVLADASYTLTATDTDLAGNIGSATVSFTLDTTPPVVTAALAHDTGVSASDGITNTAALTGSAGPGGTITIRNGAVVLDTIVVPASSNIVSDPNLGPANAGVGYGAVVGWVEGTTSAGSNNAMQPFWDNGTVPAGIGTVGFVQYANNYIAQTLNLVVGATYTLTYLENARAYGGGTPLVETLVGGQVVVAAHLDTPVAGTASFRTKTATFVATAATETLEFLTTGTGSGSTDVTALYTGISVTAVAVPWSFTPALTDGTYTLTVSETDIAGNTGVATLPFTLVTAPPVLVSPTTVLVPEGTPVTTAAYAAATTDAARLPVTYALGGADASAFAINASTGVVDLKAVPNYQVKGSYSLTLTASDSAGNSASQAVRILIQDTAPAVTSAAAVSVAEGIPAGTTIYTATATDVPGTILTYGLSGPDASAFIINAATGAVSFRSVPNFQSKAAYSVTVQASDGTLTSSQALAIGVTDLAPVIASAASVSIAEGAAAGASIYVAAASDVQGTTVSYALSGTDAAAFAINAATGAVSFRSVPNFQSKAAYSVTVQASDGTLSSSQALATGVTDLAPVIASAASVSIAEGTAAGATIYVAAASDVPGTAVSYALSGTDAAAFAINAATGAVSFRSVPNFQSKAAYSVNLLASDGTLTGTEALAVSVTDIAPIVTSAATASVIEGTATTATIYTAIASDVPGTTLTYGLSGTDAGAFTINAATGAVLFKAVPNYQVQNSYHVTIAAADGTLTGSQALTVTVVDVAPVIAGAATVSVVEGTSAASVLYTATASDVVGTTLSYALAGADAGLLAINAATGAITLKAAPSYASKSVYTATILASDGTLTGTEALTVDVTPIPVLTAALSHDTGSSAADGITNNPALTGTADAGQVVTISNGPATLGSATANAAGVWSFTPTLADGAATLTATETNSFGNTGSATLSFTLDTAAPGQPVIVGITPDAFTPGDGITNTGAITITGNAEAGSTVSVSDGATVIGSALAVAGGAWSFTPGTALAAGSHSLTATATDAAGNTSVASVAYVVGVVPPPTLALSSLPETVAEGMSLGNLWTQIVGNGRDAASFDQASMTLTGVNTAGTTGLVTFNAATQTLTYFASGADPAHPVDSFGYTLTDGQGQSVSGTVAVTVAGAALPTIVSTTAGAHATATGTGQRLIGEASGQVLVGSSAGGDEFFGVGDTRVSAAGSGNTVFAMPGNHTVALGANNNTATLGDGNNTVSATGTGNTVSAGNGNAIITGMTGNATITLGNGNDTITLSGANNRIMVGTGNVNISAGTGGNERVTAGDGTNTITLGGAGDVVIAGNGANTVTATGASASVTLGNGANRVTVTGTGDTIATGSGNDVIATTVGGETIRAGLGLNTISFKGSSNSIVNQGGTDSLTDSGTNNTIVLGAGLDTVNAASLTNGDVFDLRAALAMTAWDHLPGDIGNYVSLGVQGANTTISVGGATLAVITNGGSVSLSSFLTHSQTS